MLTWLCTKACIIYYISCVAGINKIGGFHFVCMQCDRKDDALSCNGLYNQHFCLLCYQLTTKSVEMFYSIMSEMSKVLVGAVLVSVGNEGAQRGQRQEERERLIEKARRLRDDHKPWTNLIIHALSWELLPSSILPLNLFVACFVLWIWIDCYIVCILLYP